MGMIAACPPQFKAKDCKISVLSESSPGFHLELLWSLCYGYQLQVMTLFVVLLSRLTRPQVSCGCPDNPRAEKILKTEANLLRAVVAGLLRYDFGTQWVSCLDGRPGSLTRMVGLNGLRG
jgi:hypothetical protein